MPFSEKTSVFIMLVQMEDVERESREHLIHLAIPRTFRVRIDPLEILNDAEFRERFRLTRKGFSTLYSILKEEVSPPTTRTASICGTHKQAIFLEHLGSASLQRTTALTLGCSQATVSRIIAEVSDVLYRKRKSFIFWPDFSDQKKMERRFFEICGIPNVVGALDGSHVKITAPSESEDSYVNRKDYHSINMAGICDLDQRFLWISAKLPGRTHDSRVFRSSKIYMDFLEGRKTGILLADSAYRSERFLLKPILNEQRTPAEARYTDAQCRGRVIIENAFGSLKRQFQALHNELRHKPTRSAKIIIACCCLRNFAIQMREPSFTESESTTPEYPEAGSLEPDVPDSGNRNDIRSFIVDRYFS